MSERDFNHSRYTEVMFSKSELMKPLLRMLLVCEHLQCDEVKRISWETTTLSNVSKSIRKLKTNRKHKDLSDMDSHVAVRSLSDLIYMKWLKRED